eukprot:scaffold195267_cov47-Prasinocladus_malaysianus.AAC.1
MVIGQIAAAEICALLGFHMNIVHNRDMMPPCIPDASADTPSTTRCSSLGFVAGYHRATTPTSSSYQLISDECRSCLVFTASWEGRGTGIQSLYTRAVIATDERSLVCNLYRREDFAL